MRGSVAGADRGGGPGGVDRVAAPAAAIFGVVGDMRRAHVLGAIDAELEVWPLALPRIHGRAFEADAGAAVDPTFDVAAILRRPQHAIDEVVPAAAGKILVFVEHHLANT